MDCEYGTVANEAVEWLADRGFLRDGDCAMNVACGRGGFAAPMCRKVRVMVCMDLNRSALEETAGRCTGGCRTELLEADWEGYSVSRGGYDVCMMSPSHLCFKGSALRHMEDVASRSCMAILPTEHGYRRILKAALKSLGAPAGFQGMPDYPDPRPFALWLRGSDRGLETERFSCVVRAPVPRLVDDLVADVARRGVPEGTSRDVVEGIVSSLSRGGEVRYGFTAQVYAWEKG